jgi:hypothetical protein
VGKHHVQVSIPPFTLSPEEADDLQDDYIFNQEAAVSEIMTNWPNLGISLRIGQDMLKGSGGICFTDVTFAGVLSHWACEIFPDVVDEYNRHEGNAAGFRSWIEYNTLGRTSSHREFAQSRESLSSIDLLTDQSKSIVTNKELVLYGPLLAESSRASVNKATSIVNVLGHLVNLRHPASPFVEGLNVELLPFQLQSLQWALEQETTLGGLQCFWCTKLPNVEQPNMALYYNPIIAKLSLEKPALVRGGILSEQRGTVRHAFLWRSF